MLVVGVLSLVLTVAFVAAVVTGYTLAAQRARQAADLAAVSAAKFAALGEDGCPEARRVAAANSARVVSCAQVGDSIEYAVSVEIRVPVRRMLPGLPGEIPATAHAGHVE